MKFLFVLTIVKVLTYLNTLFLHVVLVKVLPILHFVLLTRVILPVVLLTLLRMLLSVKKIVELPKVFAFLKSKTVIT